MKRIIIRSYLMLGSILFMGCPETAVDYDMKLLFINDTDEKLAYYFRFEEAMKSDTLLDDDFPWGSIDGISEQSMINPNDIHYKDIVSENYKDLFNENTFTYFFFNYDSLMTIPWERIREDYIVAKRFDIETWEELESMNFEFYYP